MSRQATAWMLGVGMGACLAIATPAEAEPLPVQGRLGLLISQAYGFDAELSWRNTPWTVGFVSYTGRAGDSRTAWARFAWTMPDGGRMGLIAGANEYPESSMCAGFGPCAPDTRFGALLALSYVLRTERLWMRLTPQYVFPVDGGQTHSNQAFYKSGLPWVEVGFQPMSWLDLSVRFSEMPLAATVVF
jgi:hypothetical protein